jgi:hypothetical protein
MFSIFKRNKDNPEVPEWASFFDGKEYSEFLKAIEHYFGKKNISYNIGEGILTASANDFGFNNLGLINVAQVCKHDKPRNYKGIVSEHFESMIRANKFEAEFDKIIHVYDKIKQYIGVCLYPNEYVAHIVTANR